MKKQNKIGLFKGLKITGITITVILFLLFILPILFPQAITNKVDAKSDADNEETWVPEEPWPSRKGILVIGVIIKCVPIEGIWNY